MGRELLEGLIADSPQRDERALRALAEGNELVLEEVDRFTLPMSGATRTIARFRRV